MKEYVIPTLNLLMKTIPRIDPKPQNTTAIEKQESTSLISEPQKKQYTDFSEFNKSILKLKLHKKLSLMMQMFKLCSPILKIVLKNMKFL